MPTPETIRRALVAHTIPERAAEYLEMTVDQLARLCLTYDIEWPSHMLPPDLSDQRKDAGLAGHLASKRRDHLREFVV